MLITVYGQSKTGKTTFASSHPRTILLDLEDGAGYIDAKGVKVVNITDWATFAKALVTAEKAKPDVLAIDSITVAHQLALRYLAKTTPSDLLTPRPAATLQQYGQANDLIQSLILRLRALPFTVVLTAQEKVQYIDSGDADLGDNMASKEATISLPQGARTMVVMYSDVLAYSHVVNEEDTPSYRLWMQPASGIVTGFRGTAHSKRPYIDKPTVSRVYKYLGVSEGTE